MDANALPNPPKAVSRIYYSIQGEKLDYSFRTDEEHTDSQVLKLIYLAGTKYKWKTTDEAIDPMYQHVIVIDVLEQTVRHSEDKTEHVFGVLGIIGGEYQKKAETTKKEKRGQA